MTENDRRSCVFGAHRLRLYIKSIAAEMKGVKAGTDIECVHRMRVASRRLRSALPVFSFCFPKKQFRSWMKELKGITRALGDARDTDVQVEYLDQYRSSLPPGSSENAGIDRIRMYLLDHRGQEQETILAALDILEKRNVLGNLSAAVTEAAKGRLHGKSGSRSNKPVARLAALHIGNARDKLLAFGGSVHDPRDIPGHHAARIAAKRLRYTLEIFRPLWPDRLRPAIKSLKRLQELLGQIHDCDVWIVLLSGLTSPETAGTGGGDPSLTGLVVSKEAEAGILALLNERRRFRENLYGQLVREWDKLSGPLEENLRPVVIASTGGGDVPVSQRSSEERPPVAKDLGAFAGIYPEGQEHSRQVTKLALQLFDGLVTLHGYADRERSLLEYAGLLHDIGWVDGQKGHHTRSCRMILLDRSLPVSSRERAIIALVARYHRKNVPEQPDPVTAGLKSRDRKCLLALASLLRIADGLDYTHAGRVVSVACTITPGVVTCVPVYSGDGGIERERALAKADLFGRVFLRRFEIP